MNQLILFLLSASWGPPPPHQPRTSYMYGSPLSHASLTVDSVVPNEISDVFDILFRLQHHQVSSVALAGLECLHEVGVPALLHVGLARSRRSLLVTRGKRAGVYPDIISLKHESSIFRSVIQPCM